MKRIPNIVCQPLEVHFLGIISLSPPQMVCVISYLLFKEGPPGKICVDGNIKVHRSEGN